MKRLFLPLIFFALPLPAQPVITNQPVSRALWTGGNVTFAVGVSNAGAFTYRWQLNGTNLPNAIMTTVAGNGVATYAGDGGLATKASLYYPQGVGFDAIGNLYIADNNNNRVRKVDTNGIITTVAGDGYGASSGSGRFAGDGGAATNASLYRPNNIAFDGQGNLYIADIFNNRIRKVNTNGMITTVAGGGTGGGGLLGDGGHAVNATLNYPASVVFDTADNYYIADLADNRVRVVTNGIINTAMTSASPQGVGMDAAGNLYVTETANHRIRKMSTNGVITTVAGNGIAGYTGDAGMATNASLEYPWSVAFDSSGKMYVADLGTNVIRRVDTNGIITTFAGLGPPGFSGDGHPAAQARLNSPACVALDAAGNLFIADWNNNRIRKVSNTQGPILTLNNVSTTNTGNYQLVVTGPSGSVTSSVVNLTVASAPLISKISHNAGHGAQLDFLDQPGSTNVVQCATNLLQPVWQPLFTNSAGADGSWNFMITNVADVPARFYRTASQ